MFDLLAAKTVNFVVILKEKNLVIKFVYHTCYNHFSVRTVTSIPCRVLQELFLTPVLVFVIIHGM